MDGELVKRWNLCVGLEDTIYHLGDFTLGNEQVAGQYFSQLNGDIRVLANIWHHDRRWLPILDEYRGSPWFHSASGIPVSILQPLVVLEFPEYGDGKYSKALVLCHYPLATWDRSHFGSYHLHGHSHGKHQGSGLSLDVGVDSNQFSPVSIDDVVRRMQEIA